MYLLGVTLPAHLSPFVEESDGDYIPPEREQQLAQLADSAAKEDDDTLDDEGTEQEMKRKN